MADKNSDKQLASEQSREGPGNGGIPRSDMNANKRGEKRKLESKTLEENYEAILEIEKGQKSKT